MSDNQLSVIEPTQALAVQEAPAPQEHALTPSQARIESVARVMDAAMNKASTLALTPEENAALEADFPDDAFKPGAAGKENLIYIEHAFLRDRFNAVIGRGQWALLRTRPHWAEEFRTNKGEEAVRLYADCALLVRGCMVAEAIGDMTYYKNNASQNYGDAAEGAVTAAFRRCAKNFGVGLQAWKKDWCEGWWQRKKGHRPQQSAPKAYEVQMPILKPTTTVLAPAPVTFKSSAERKARLDALLLKSKLKLVSDLEKGDPHAAIDFMQKTGQLMPNETALSEANELTLFHSVPQAPDDRESDSDWWARVNEAIARDAQKVKASFEDFCNGGQIPDAEVVGEELQQVMPERDALPDAKEMSGFVKVVTKKPTAKGGTRYGVLIVQDMGDREGGEWVNSFDDVDGSEAEKLKGQHVAVAYTEGKFGKDLCKRAIRRTQ